MENTGPLYERLDIKILILFVMSKLPGEVDYDTLVDLCTFDSGVGYFEFSDCLNELVNTGHILCSDGYYKITEKGIKNSDAVSSSLPFSMRARALRLIEPVDERLRREAMISAKHDVKDNVCTVHLSMSDSEGVVIDMSFICANEDHASRIEKYFKRNAENCYEKIISLFED